MTRGSTPYENVKNILQYLKDGKHLPIPECCPIKLFEILLKCWSLNLEKRPVFEELCEKLEEINKKLKIQINIPMKVLYNGSSKFYSLNIRR
jgi:hypothetical protein